MRMERTWHTRTAILLLAAVAALLIFTSAQASQHDNTPVYPGQPNTTPELMSLAQKLGESANWTCVPVIPDSCGCGKQMSAKGCVPSGNKHQCMCTNTTNGFTSVGVCVSTLVCQGTKTAEGGAQEISKAVGDIFKGLLDKLMQKGGGGGGGDQGQQPGTDPSQFQQGCTSYYTVTVPTTDPCAIYNPNPLGGLGGSSDISSSLLGALGQPAASPPSVSEKIASKAPQSAGDEAAATTAAATTTTATTTPAASATSSAALSPELRGDVKITDGGATVVAGSRDVEGNVEIAGFYGGDTLAGQASSLAARMCETRPWASTTGLLSIFIPTTFLDGLCTWSGYKVGATVPDVQPRTVTPPSARPAQTPPPPPPPAVITIPPEVEIWAEPARVRLGVRTYIFWNSRGVDTCRVSGPSFTQEGVSGGASTVPLSDASTFSVVCSAPDGSTVSDSVTVNLAL
ncbi:hypothetical protein COU20_01790 [Candidatus Kaiserbacteria bacterium CG10_big_fil_rev_8_21_14_0_10_59_10]|uniref:Uncharacterized protein n=1 Tax=Candidatus Kaiserbacteria bacterium CG10_big_fil_rev_8_21_14_0_10_59_10 TaxID=1974612 RepID=A0A2H0U7Y3_9BACT|nr:MAG: hypothetical protein COU20_01790 [Candidatus Kaiserbacteria bacterium CG10_big_fil_rev_8_21_14_0_10_59_10]